MNIYSPRNLLRQESNSSACDIYSNWCKKKVFNIGQWDYSSQLYMFNCKRVVPNYRNL